LIPRGKLRGRGRGAFRQRAGVVRLFSNPIKEARARLLRGGRKGIIGIEAKFRSRKMVKGGISKPTRGGYVPGTCSLTDRMMDPIAIPLPSLPVLLLPIKIHAPNPALRSLW
jgi:hypothetical protein